MIGPRLSRFVVSRNFERDDHHDGYGGVRIRQDTAFVSKVLHQVHGTARIDEGRNFFGGYADVLTDRIETIVFSRLFSPERC